MKQRQLAKLSGVPVASINGMLTGKKSYSTENLIAVADALELSLDALIRGYGPGISSESLPSTVVLDGVYRVTLSKLDIPISNKKESAK